MPTAGELLDDAATAVFGGEAGLLRVAPLLARWDDAGLQLHEGDPELDLLHALRTDWALCDAPLGDLPGDTYLDRLLEGRIDGVRPKAAWARLRTQYVGLFEVWPGPAAWLRDLRRGLCVAATEIPWIEAVPAGPSALWEVRILIKQGRAELCRAPLPYPVVLVDDLHARNRRRFGNPSGHRSDPHPPASWEDLRRGWLRSARAPRAAPGLFFTL